MSMTLVKEIYRDTENLRTNGFSCRQLKERASKDLDLLS